MSKNLKLSFILYLVFASIVVAFSTLSKFFGGVGVNFVALCAVLVALIVLMCLDADQFKMLKDLFFIACAFLFVEFIEFFALEFKIGGADVAEVFWGIQYVVSLIGLIYFAYIAFRFVSVVKGKKFRFVEAMLTGTKQPKKEKTAKELANGALEDKPNNLNRDVEEEETVIELDNKEE